MLLRLSLPGAPLALVLGLVSWLSVSGASSQKLFVIERSKNANVVRYDVRVEKGGRYDVRRPLDVYWLMNAENGRREELTDLERRIAYGYEMLPGAKMTEFGVRLVAVKGRSITVRRRGDEYAPEAAINGEPAEIETIYVATKESKLPKVLYVELRGKSVKDGRAVRERIMSD